MPLTEEFKLQDTAKMLDPDTFPEFLLKKIEEIKEFYDIHGDNTEYQNKINDFFGLLLDDNNQIHWKHACLSTRVFLIVYKMPISQTKSPNITLLMKKYVKELNETLLVRKKG